MKIAFACDHAGFETKEMLIGYLESKEGFEILDFGTFSKDSCDYPDFAHPMAKAVEEKKHDFGISLCGSGNGINMVANKYPGIRSALCWTEEIAILARQHNDANICAIPARFIDTITAISIMDAFLETEFEGGRHQKRIDKISIKH
ncbi:MAG: ribose 5-phosphate isomerase B [Bacteroidota bacterium]